MRTAGVIAQMISATSFLFADQLTFEGVMLFLRAFNFPRLMATSTALICHYFTRFARSLMATIGANMTTI